MTRLGTPLPWSIESFLDSGSSVCPTTTIVLCAASSTILRLTTRARVRRCSRACLAALAVSFAGGFRCGAFELTTSVSPPALILGSKAVSAARTQLSLCGAIPRASSIPTAGRKSQFHHTCLLNRGSQLRSLVAMSDAQSGVSGDENEIEQGREDAVDKEGKGVSNRKDERKLSKEDRQEVLAQAAHPSPSTRAHASHSR